MIKAAEHKPTILVVDDSRLMRVAARKILKNDFDILEAQDGEDAWEMLQVQKDVMLVMSDLSMPNLDGLGLLARIRGSDDQRLSELPVIVVTGAEDDDGTKTRALEAGASDFITKPFESVQLLARAKTHVRQQHTRLALRASENSKQQLEATSTIDLVTGLPNQQAFNEQLEQKLAYAIRYRTDLAILLVQLDRYKVLFLRHGKKQAESLLTQFSQRLTTDRRREDTVARITIDTFGLLLPAANPVGARRVAEQLARSLAEAPLEVEGKAITVTASIAIHSPTLHTDSTAEGLLTDVRERLTEARMAGGNRILLVEDGTTTAPLSATRTADSRMPAAAVGAAEVQAALEALAAGKEPDQPLDGLVRAVMPVLTAWNHQRNDRHTTLIEALQLALDQQERRTAVSHPPSRS